MRHCNVANVLFACVLLISCAPATRGNSNWDGLDYGRSPPARKISRDFDADYSLPVISGCVDDAPGCY